MYDRDFDYEGAVRGSNRRNLLFAIIVVGSLMVGYLTLHVPPTNTPRCVRSHVEINNVPAHYACRTGADHCLTYDYIPAERKEYPVCDEYTKEEAK
jgi:hypothetical protein